MDPFELKENICRFYKLHPEFGANYRSELNQLSQAKNWYEIVFPYKWALTDLSHWKVDIEYRDDVSLVCSKNPMGWNLFFPKEFSVDECQRALYLLMLEQYPESPHKYIHAPKGKAILDFGCSEGVYSNIYGDFSCDTYLFDEEWWMTSAVLNARAKNVTFVPGLVNETTKLDIQFNQPVGMIKIDVEGMEDVILDVCKDIILRDHPIIQAAAYHYQDEFINLIQKLKDLGYDESLMESPKGFMVYPNDPNQYSPYFRKGLIIAK